MSRALKMTGPVIDVKTIEDIEAIEDKPYDDLVTARNLYDLFLATSMHVGDRKALTVLRSPDPTDIALSLTHTELLAEITMAANLFHSIGLRPGEEVAAFLTPTLPALPAVLLGAQVAGVASSLNYLLSREALVDLLNSEKAALLVVSARHLDETCWTKAENILEAVPSLQKVLVIGGTDAMPTGYEPIEPLLSQQRSDALSFEPSTDRNTLSALFHTGGTTGRAKLVPLTHGNQIHAAFGFGQVFAYDENDVVINGFPFFHVGGTITVGLSVLAAGGHVIVPSPYAMRPPEVARNYWDLVAAFGATVVNGVPTSIAAITNSWRRGNDVSTVRMAATGGAVLPEAIGARFEEITGIRLYETYGMTETAAAIAFNPARGMPVPGSVGFRAPFSQTRVVQLGAPDLLCRANEAGLVRVRGPQVFSGYVDASHNAGSVGDDGWLTTGDVGYLTDDQRLVLTGREKDLIVRSGHNIDPAAIEDVANRFPGVQISAAVGMPDQYAGEVPALFVVPMAGGAVDLEALGSYLEANLHEPPARPRRILTIPELPVTAVGKIFKPALRDMAIKEKVRIEVEAICARQANPEIDVTLDAQKRSRVQVVVPGATADQLARLDASLKSLPQTYVVSGREVESPQGVRLDYADGVAILTLDRPESMNALSAAMVKSLESQLRTVAAIPGLRVVILTGTGRAFCAGGDLIEFETALKAGGSVLVDILRYNQDVIQMIEDLPVPVIGAANGAAVAGGLELLLACDMILAVEGSTIGDGHAKYGVVPAGGATVRLVERIGRAKASRLFYSAALFDAGLLAKWGLVDEVVQPGNLMDRATEIARQICSVSPEVVRRVKALTRKSSRPERQAGIRAELDSFFEHTSGTDLTEGLAAFRVKRKPSFREIL